MSLLRFRYTGLWLGILVVEVCSVQADQPIMNMMPRWDGGYGIQIRAEHIRRADLKQGSDVVGRGFSEEVNQVYLEGVYTWDRSIRLTAKLPYVLNARREVMGAVGEKVVQHDKGVGDLTLALPLKHYFNLDSRSGSWTLAPQMRIPLGRDDDEFEVWDGVFGAGLSAGYETETYDWFFATSMSIWVFEEPEPVEWRYALDVGWNLREDAQLLWESDLSWDDESQFFLSAGPALYWRWNDQVHLRIEWKHDFVSRVSKDELDHGNGDRVSAGIGFVF